MFRLYVDEVGSDDLIHAHEENHRYLSLSGVAMQTNHARDYLTPALSDLKARVFDVDPDTPLNLHRKDIVQRKGAFGVLQDPSKCALFDKLLKDVIWEADYRFFTVLIDKLWMLRQRHWKKTHPYHYLMEMLVERYVHFLERVGACGDIMPEARGASKDKALQDAFDIVRSNATGTGYISSMRIEGAVKSKSLKFRTKKDNISGLQLCDLIAHPSHMYIRLEINSSVTLGRFANEVLDALIERKYDRSEDNRKLGYGIKYLPQVPFRESTTARLAPRRMD